MIEVIEGSRHREDAALLALLGALRRRGYRFVTPTPATHARVVARSSRKVARSLSDVLGWSLPFSPEVIDAELLDLLQSAGAVEPAADGLLHSRYRVSSLGGELFLHSAYPTEDRDAVFFGPDSYRFARLIEDELARRPVSQDAEIVDIGTGSGVGAIVAAKSVGAAAIGSDVNPAALRLAAINARAAHVPFRAVLAEDLDWAESPIDLALANPPYIIDDNARQYRDGGGMHGGEVSLQMARAAVRKLAPGGRLILYTGSAIVNGEDALGGALADLAKRTACTLVYEELDPDVFGEELERPAYREVDRIALVAAILTRSAT